MKLGDGSIIKEHKYIIGKNPTDFVACRIKLEPKEPCIPSNSGVGLKESISVLESSMKHDPLEISSKSNLGPLGTKRKYEESTSEPEEDVEDDNEDEKFAECFLRDVYCDDSENIIGAKALAMLGVLVECGTGLRRYLRQKV